MKIVGVIVARMTSNRLPGKPLLDLAGRTNLERHVERMQMVRGIDEIYLATSKSHLNQPLFEEATKLGLKIYAGEDEDVVERFVSIGHISGADALIRVGCDKPLFCYELLQVSIDAYNYEDYIHLMQGCTVGITYEILSLRALEETHKYYRGTAIAQYIREHPHKFKIRSIKSDAIYYRPEYRLALDTPEDYQLHKAIFEALSGNQPISTKDAIRFLDDNPSIGLLNKNVKEKNVNFYVKELESKPIFQIMVNEQNQYVILDRMGDIISYEEFTKYVHDPERWFKED